MEVPKNIMLYLYTWNSYIHA